MGNEHDDWFILEYQNYWKNTGDLLKREDLYFWVSKTNRICIS